VTEKGNMNQVMMIRGAKKSYVVYAIGLFVIFSVGLVVKNFNDKIFVMSETVQKYQNMIEKQTAEMKVVAGEKERVKRELEEEREENDANVKDLKDSLEKISKQCKTETLKNRDEIADLKKSNFNNNEQYRKLEAKYTTLSKSNGAAIAEIEDLKSENKLLRSRLNDASTSRANELLQLRDSVTKITLERDKYQEQYSALFKQHQQSYDSIQLLQNEKDRLQEQIRQIQRLSGSHSGGEQGNVLSPQSSSSVPPEQEQGQAAEPEHQASKGVSSSTSRAVVVEEPSQEPGDGDSGARVSSSSPASVRLQAAAEPAQAPPPLQQAANQAALPLRPAVDKAASLVRYPPVPPQARPPQVAPQARAPVHPVVQQQYYPRGAGQYQAYNYPQQHFVHGIHDNGIDVLQAPRIKRQNDFKQQNPAAWYPGAQPLLQQADWQHDGWEEDDEEEEAVEDNQYQQPQAQQQFRRVRAF